MRDPDGDVLIVVPARGGSKGLPGKNLATVAGVSLVGRAVVRGREFVVRNGLSDRAVVVVDTDDADIAEEGRRWGASVPFLRPPSLAADDTSTADSLAHLLERFERSWDTVILLQPTSPLARAADVSACWARYRDSDLPSAVSTVPTSHPPSLALVEGERGALAWWSGRPPDEVRRQIHAPAFWPSGAVYVVDAAWFMNHRSFISAGRTAGVPVDPWRAIDVDDATDLEAARTRALFGRDPSIPDADPDEADVVVGAVDVHGTLTRVLERVDGDAGPRAVLLRSDGTDAAVALARIPAVRSIFGLPVLWDAADGSRVLHRAARLLGARLIGAKEDSMQDDEIGPEWLDTLRNQ